jgi:DNA-binding CsgD family transcriptional regulator
MKRRANRRESTEDVPGRPDASGLYKRKRNPERRKNIGAAITTVHPIPGCPEIANVQKAVLPPPITCEIGILDALRCGSFLLDFLGQVISHNIVAHSCLGDGLNLIGSRLTAADPMIDHCLQHMITAAISRTDQPNGPRSLAIQRRSRLPLIIYAMRLHDNSQAPGRARVLLVTIDPDIKQEPSREMLTQAFALTRSEADVAIGILSGRSLAQIAAARGVKIGTIRKHSKVVFSKTNTRGQAHLTGVLSRLALVALPADDSVMRA